MKHSRTMMTAAAMVAALTLSLGACQPSSAPAPSEAQQATTAAQMEQESDTKAPEMMEASSVVFTSGEWKLTIPKEIADQLIVKTQENGEGALFSVSEKASVEAAKARGTEEVEGAGQLFEIVDMSGEELKELLEMDIPGRKLFARDAQNPEDHYFVFCTPTDVRFDRDSTEKMMEDQEKWTALVTWAATVPDLFLAENSSLMAASPTREDTGAVDNAQAQMDTPTIDVIYTDYYQAVMAVQPGSAGSSLRTAEAAVNVVSFAKQYNLVNADGESLRYEMLTAWEDMSEEERTAFDAAFMDVVNLIDSCKEDFSSVRGSFEDAGKAEDMEALLNDENAMDCWAILLGATLTMGNQPGL